MSLYEISNSMRILNCNLSIAHHCGHLCLRISHHVTCISEKFCVMRSVCFKKVSNIKVVKKMILSYLVVAFCLNFLEGEDIRHL